MALVLSCFASFVFASTSTVAGQMVPFNGTVSGYVESQQPVDQCTVHAHVVNFGNANQLRAFTATEFYPNFCQDPPNITYTGTFDWVAVNGDEILGTFEGYLTDPDMDGVYDNYETAAVTGRTGRFSNATGSFGLGGADRLYDESALICAPLARYNPHRRLNEVRGGVAEPDGVSEPELAISKMTLTFSMPFCQTRSCAKSVGRLPQELHLTLFPQG